MATNIESIIDFFDNNYQDIQEKVEKTVKSWNATLREKLRSQMRLTISQKEPRITIPISVECGFPVAWHNIFDTTREYVVWQLIMNQRLLFDTYRGIELLGNNSLTINQSLMNTEDQFNNHDLEDLMKKLLRLMGKLEEYNFAEQLKMVNKDILGVYRFGTRYQNIEIFWMAIGVVANLLNIDIEDLTIITLTHELAHAYSHLGQDSDQQVWNLDDFACTDDHVIEGLAQFYTEEVCKQLLEQKPDLIEAFNKLKDIQPVPYTDYINWNQNNIASFNEIIRYSMLTYRKKSLRQYEEFLDELNTVTHQFHHLDCIQKNLFDL